MPKAKSAVKKESPVVEAQPVAEPKVAYKGNLWEAIDGPGVKCDRFSMDNGDAVRMMHNLMSQPKVRTRVPREAKEPINAFISPVLNSLRINIRKGVSVDLPEQLAELIEDSYYASEKAISPIQTNPFTGRQNQARLDMKSDAEVAMLTQ